MSAYTLIKGSWWIYRGPGPGKGLPHQVVQVLPNEVITWSVPLTGEVGGWSWLGPVTTFLEHFTKS